ncbi:MAG: DUF2249 domain-containing protein [Verrucomicrobia bacterium]|nr:DUF2249 domain-containing protein [Verrucomicrobiota bacterium]
MSQQIVTLDVREDLRLGREPFSKIMGAVAQLKPDQALLLIAPFEPAPLYGVLGRQGFTHESKAVGNGDWEILFRRDSGDAARLDRGTAKGAAAAPTAPAPGPRDIRVVDARGLEPPQPMVVILEALQELPAEGELRAHTDRKPMHLYSQLLERGFTGQTDEQADGSFITHIRRR